MTDTVPRGREDPYYTGIWKNVNDHLHAFNRVTSKKQKHTHTQHAADHTLMSKIMCEQKQIRQNTFNVVSCKAVFQVRGDRLVGS